MAGGDHDWSAGEVPTAANFDDYLQLQTLQKHASASARDTALSARKREGLATIQDDTNTITVYSGSTWSTIGPVHGELTSWTPAVVQGATPAVTAVGSYLRTGRRVPGDGRCNVTGSGTAANSVLLSLPVPANTTLYAAGLSPIGWASIYDQSTGILYHGPLIYVSTSSCTIEAASGTAVNSYLGSTTFTAALAANDVVAWNFSYEAAGDA